MVTARISLAQPIESRTDSVGKDSRTVNCMFETRDQVKKEIVKRPGLSSIALTPAIPSAQAQGMYGSLSYLWVATNSNLYRIDPVAGTTTVGGSIGTGQISFTQTGPAQNYVFLHSDTAAYYVAPAGTTPVAPANASITTYTVTNAGTGYIAVPSATVSGGGGSSATANAFLGVVSVTIGSGGTGYAVNDVLSFASTGGSATTACALTVTSVSGAGVITGLSVTTAGIYSTLPTLYGVAVPVALTGGIGTTATATLAWGVSSVTMNAAGTGYTSTPTVAITAAPAGGTTAVVTGNVSFFPTAPYAYGTAYLDGYVFIATQSGRLYNSAVDDPTTWGALDYISIDNGSDSIVAISKHLNYIVTFGKFVTQFFYDAGVSPGSPMLPNQSASLSIGCAAPQSVQSLEQALIWVGSGKSTGRAVYILDGISPVKISTRYIEKFLDTYSSTDLLSDVRSWVTRVPGHTLYGLTLRSQALTFVFDVDEKIWYQWTSSTLGVDSYFQGAWMSTLNKVPYGLDDSDGTLFRVDVDVYNDNGNPITVTVITDILDSGTTNRKFYKHLEIVGDKTTGTMSVYHSDDDYVTWSSARTVNLAASRPQLNVLGAARRRAWKFIYSANYALRIDAAEITFDMGGIENNPERQAARR